MEIQPEQGKNLTSTADFTELAFGAAPLVSKTLNISQSELAILKYISLQNFLMKNVHMCTSLLIKT